MSGKNMEVSTKKGKGKVSLQVSSNLSSLPTCVRRGPDHETRLILEHGCLEE